MKQFISHNSLPHPTPPPATTPIKGLAELDALKNTGEGQAGNKSII